MPAPKKKSAKKPAKQVAKAVESSGGALKKAWKTPDKRDGLSFKDTVLVLIIAAITLALGYYLGSMREGSRAAALINRVVSQNAITQKAVCP